MKDQRLCQYFKNLLFTFMFVISFGSLLAQYGTMAQIRNVDFKLVNEQVIITYDLLFAKPRDLFDIEVEVFNTAKYKIDAQTLEGDFSDVKRGRNKKVVWYIANDFANFEDNIYVIVTAKHKNFKEINRVSKLDAMWKSTLWPGWGSAQTSLNKINYAKGFLGYGSLTASLFLYDSYKQKLRLSQDINLSSEKHQQYKTQSEIYMIATYVALGAAGLTWMWEYSGILFRPNVSKKIKMDFEAGVYNNQVYPVFSLKLNM